MQLIFIPFSFSSSLFGAAAIRAVFPAGAGRPAGIRKHLFFFLLYYISGMR
jgi:hypothetical protein